ncbi:N-formylglutamate amidohydrolase [Roseovarius phycicola]|uniref:N-formylglutamate amidohydrolase n=1 Tax=Roseovarius phycicola TaxID=3080976 RepID=A0ABZ2HGC4_9RHOB
MTNTAFSLTRPNRRTTSVVFASPHSGRGYSSHFLRRSMLNEKAIRSSEDAFVDQLFEVAPQFGASLITATVPRAYVDLNRSIEELDPALIDGVRKGGHNPRVSSGLGVIPRVVANGQAIYSGKITLAEAQQRLERYWAPYHTALRTELDQAHEAFGEAILIDCHSMPHEAMDSVVRTGIKRPEIVLGDRFGAAASEAIVDRIEAAFVHAGFAVTRNTPFAGAFITQNYGKPANDRHAIQIEVDRALYMNEKTIRPNAEFATFKRRLQAIIADIARIGRPEAQPLAAE